MMEDPLLRLKPGLAQVFDSGLPQFGNSVFFTVTGNKPNIRFNNMVKMIYVPSYWVITIWIKDKVKNEEWECEWMMNYLLQYNECTQYCSQVLASFIRVHCPHLDMMDLSGKNWYAETLIRKLSKQEIIRYKNLDVEFDGSEEEVTEFCVNLHHVEYEPDEVYNEFHPEKPDYRQAWNARIFIKNK